MTDGNNSDVITQRFDTDFLKELQEFQNKFSEYFNVASIIFDNDNKQVTNPSGFGKFCDIIQKAKDEGRLSSDPTKTVDEIHTKSCSFFSNIAETIIPIEYEGETISTWAVSKNYLGNVSREDINDVADRIGGNSDELWNELQKIPITTQEEFDRSVYFLHTTISTLMKMRRMDDKLRDGLEHSRKVANITGHDMREHIRIILGFMDLLDKRYRSKLDSEFDTYLYYIKDSGNRLRHVADDLMELCEKGE